MSTSQESFLDLCDFLQSTFLRVASLLSLAKGVLLLSCTCILQGHFFFSSKPHSCHFKLPLKVLGFLRLTWGSTNHIFCWPLFLCLCGFSYSSCIIKKSNGGFSHSPEKRGFSLSSLAGDDWCELILINCTTHIKHVFPFYTLPPVLKTTLKQTSLIPLLKLRTDKRSSPGDFTRLSSEWV